MVVLEEKEVSIGSLAAGQPVKYMWLDWSLFCISLRLTTNYLFQYKALKFFRDGVLAMVSGRKLMFRCNFAGFCCMKICAAQTGLMKFSLGLRLKLA